MSIIVYLSNSQMQVVDGTRGEKKISVKEYYVEDLPQGCMINGMLMDSESFVSFMKQFWAAKGLSTKDVHLVINSNKFIGKNIDMPKLNDKKTLGYITREYKDMEREEEFLYGYIKLFHEDKKMQHIYSEAISAEFLNDYIEVFKEIGVTLKGIYSGESGLINLVATTCARQYKTFVLQICDKMTLITILWAGGKFHYYNSVRCFQELGSEGYAHDVAKSISQIIQFMQANKMEETLECVLLAGVGSSDMNMYQNAIFDMGIDVSVKSYIYDHKVVSGKYTDSGQFNHAVCGLFINGKYQNYLTQIGKKAQDDKKTKSNAPIYIAACFALMLVLTVASMVARIQKERQLTSLQDYNNSPQVMMEVARYDALVDRNRFLILQEESVKKIIDDVYTYPLGDTYICDEIKNCATPYADVTFDSFAAKEGYIAFKAEADNVEDINLFIKKLYKKDIFTSIDYTGYAFSDTTQKWDIHVKCVLAESAGR